MALGSNSRKTNFYIRFLSRNLKIKCHSWSSHQLFFISLFLEVRFSEAVISKCHFPGAAAFQHYFSVSVVAEVSPGVTPLRLFLQLIKIYTYKLSPLFGLCLNPWAHSWWCKWHFSCPGPLLQLLFLLNVLCCLLHHAVKACTIQKCRRDFSWRCICNFVLS